MRNLIKLIVVAALSTTIAGTAIAQDAKQAVGARQAHMKLRAFYLGQLGAMAKGEVDYDAEKAAAAAGSLQTLGQVDQSAMWPQGSDNVSMPEGTRALPAIWETFPAISEIGQAYGEAVATLASTAGDGVEALQAGVGGVGKQCGACHDKFRQPNN